MRKNRRWLLYVLVLACATTSCGGDPLIPFNSEVNNATDSFQFQATDVRNITTTLTYTWPNTGTVANVNHSTTTTGGTARLIVRAANASEVYNKQLEPSLTEQTETGTAGNWTVQLVLSGYSGTLNFRLQKP